MSSSRTASGMAAASPATSSVAVRSKVGSSPLARFTRTDGAVRVTAVSGASSSSSVPTPTTTGPSTAPSSSATLAAATRRTTIGASVAVPARSPNTSAIAATNAARANAQAAAAYVQRHNASPSASYSSNASPVPTSSSLLSRPSNYKSPSSRLLGTSPPVARAANGAASASSSSSSSAPSATRSLIRSTMASSAVSDSSPTVPRARLTPAAPLRTAASSSSSTAVVTPASVAGGTNNSSSSSTSKRASGATPNLPRVPSGTLLPTMSSSNTTNVASVSTSSSSSSSVAVRNIGINSPNAKRRLSGTGPVAASSYSSTIAQLERKYEQQFGSSSSSAPSASPSSSSSSSSSSSNAVAAAATSSPSSFISSPAASSYPPRSIMSLAPSSNPSSSTSSSTVTSTRPSAFPSVASAPAPAATASSSSMWSCSQCTFDNPSRSSTCEMCLTPRNGSNAAAILAAQSMQAASYSSLSPSPNANGSNRVASSSTTAPYEQRGAQLASLARQQNRSSLGSTSSLASLLESGDAPNFDRMNLNDDAARGLTRTQVSHLRPHSRESPSHAARRTRAIIRAGQFPRAATDLSSDEEELAQEQGVPALEDSSSYGAVDRRMTRTSQAARNISSIHQRVNHLQREIDRELADIQQGRSGIGRNNRPINSNSVYNDVDERKYDSDDDEEALSDGSVSETGSEELDVWEPPALTMINPRLGRAAGTQFRSPHVAAATSSSVSSSSSSRANDASPIRAGGRVQATFSPYVSAAERMAQQEREGNEGTARRHDQARIDAAARVRQSYLPASMRNDAATAAASSNNGGPSIFRIGSENGPSMIIVPPPAGAAGAAAGGVNVNQNRAEALRQEMLFLSSLFENVRSYQQSLVSSLHRAGFVDDQAMAALPGLNVGLIHFLIESAWAAAARNGAVAAGANGDLFQSGPVLPPGHAERVKELKSYSLATAATDDCCSICLDTMIVGSVVSGLTCKHIFHTSCIKEWLTRANSCPLCKGTAIEVPKSASDAPSQAPASVAVE